MRRAGLVRRARSKDDARVVDIFLAAAGKRLKRSARAVPESLLCRIGLPFSELRRIHGDLRRLFELTKEKAA